MKIGLRICSIVGSVGKIKRSTYVGQGREGEKLGQDVKVGRGDEFAGSDSKPAKNDCEARAGSKYLPFSF